MLLLIEEDLFCVSPFWAINVFIVVFYLKAKSADIKKEWVKELKRLILENHAAVIPQTVRNILSFGQCITDDFLLPLSVRSFETGQ